MNYLSSIRRQLETQYKTNIFSDNSGWYSSTRRQLAKQYVIKSLKGIIALHYIAFCFVYRRIKVKRAGATYDNA